MLYFTSPLVGEVAAWLRVRGNPREKSTDGRKDFLCTSILQDSTLLYGSLTRSSSDLSHKGRGEIQQRLVRWP